MDQTFTWCAEERMSDKEFFKNFAKKRLSLYDMVHDDEFIDADDEWCDDATAEDDVADMEYSDAPTVRDNATSVGSARASFSASMSANESSISGTSTISGASTVSGTSTVSDPSSSFAEE